MTFSVYIGSAIYSPGTPGVADHFGVSLVAATLGLTVFVAGYGVGCTVALFWLHLGACDAMSCIVELVQTRWRKRQNCNMCVNTLVHRHDVQIRVAVCTSHPFYRQIDAMREI